MRPLRTTLLVLTIVISGCSKTYEYYVNKSLDSLYKGSTASAMSHINNAIELEPNNANAYSIRAMLFYHERKNNLAETDYREAINLDSSVPEYYYNLARVLDRQGLHKDAIVQYELSLSLPVRKGGLFKQSDAYFSMGNSYEKLGAYKAAIENYLKSLELEPSDSRVKSKLEAIKSKVKQKMKRDAA